MGVPGWRPDARSGPFSSGPASGTTLGTFRYMRMRAEQSARTTPKRHRLQVGLLAMLGYAYTVGVLLATFAGLVVTAMAIGSPGLALWLGAPLFAGGFVVVRVLLVVSREQAGVAIRPAQWPALVTLVDTLRRDLRGPRIHKVVLTTEMNASVVQIPRLVLFGPHRNVLHLGLPLMALVSPDQLHGLGNPTALSSVKAR